VTVRSTVAAIRARAGDPEQAQVLAAELEAQSGWQRVPAMLTLLYDSLGQTETALRTAEEMIEQRSARAFWIASPSYSNLHQHPRYPELLRRMNLATTVSVSA
jgi:hypothetical protein